MTAGEHHAQQIVFDRVRGKEFLDDRGECPLALQKPAQLRRKGASRALAPQDVQCAILRGGHEPRRRVFRQPANSPHLQRAAEGVLHDVLCQREVVDPKDARQRGDHAPRLVSEKMIAGLHYMFSCMTGRTSTEPPTSNTGQPFEISTACARSLASIRLKPPTRSLASAYGPSVTIFWLPLTTMPALSSGCPSSLRWPFAPSSLNHAVHFCIVFPDYALSSAIKSWYKTGTYGCFCGFERWRATRCNFKRGSARPSLLFFTEQRISAGRR